MTPALDAFRRGLDELGCDSSGWTHLDAPHPSLTLPAQHDAVGPLAIDDNGDELTVELGTKHHTHFSGYNYNGSSDTDRLLAAARDAARFVTDVLADRVCFAVDHLNGRCIGSSHFYLDAEDTGADTVRDTAIGLKGGNIHSERFLWSGPIDKDG